MKSINNVISDLSIMFQNAKKDPNITNCLLLYLVLIILIVILPIYLYQLSKGDASITSKESAYLYMFVYIIGILLFFIIFLNTGITNIIYYVIFILIIALIGVFSYYNNNSTNFQYKYSKYLTIINYVIFGFIVLVALALTFKILENSIQNRSGLLGFIIDLIFYLPCLFIDFIKYIGKEFNSTPNIVFILFIFEILLILAYYYIPRLIQNQVFQNQIMILPNAKFLKTSQQIANTDDLKPIITKNPDTYLDIKTPRENYTISLWIYLNQQYHNSASDTTNIFSYGTNDNYKPKISYFNGSDKNNTKNIFRITLTGDEFGNNGKNGYNFELNIQKWNHIAFNYTNNNVDLYINGILERTYNFKGNNPTYSLSDIISIGDDNGLDGSICNICYYTTPLTNYQIVNIYNLLSNVNPPIISPPIIS